MTAVKPHDVEGVLKRLDPRVSLVLVYGPDAGLVAERARRAAEGAVTDAGDPFQLVRLEGDAVASDPGRLADEAGTIGLFGGRRAICVRPTSRNLVPAAQAVIDLASKDALVVIEAGDLSKSSPLRTLCEKAANALALPCYADGGRDLAGVVDAMLQEANLTIDREARQVLLLALGGDRLATRSEVGKLILYAHGRRAVTLEDVEAVTSDVSTLASDAAVDAAFAADAVGADHALRRLFAESMPASVILGQALRHAFALVPQRLEVERGRGAESVAEGWRGLHFRRKAAVTKHLNAWSSDALRGAVGRLQADILATRRDPATAEAVASRALIEIAQQARAGLRRG